MIREMRADELDASCRTYAALQAGDMNKKLARRYYASLYDGVIITPPSSNAMNVLLCLAGGVLFAVGLGTISKRY